MAIVIGEVPNEAVLAMAKRRGNLIEFSIGNEVHATPANPASLLPMRPLHSKSFLQVVANTTRSCINLFVALVMQAWPQ